MELSDALGLGLLHELVEGVHGLQLDLLGRIVRAHGSAPYGAWTARCRPLINASRSAVHSSKNCFACRMIVRCAWRTSSTRHPSIVACSLSGIAPSSSSRQRERPG